MQVAELIANGVRQRDHFQRYLARFLETEIQLGHTFVALATTERILGNTEHFRVAKGDAAKAAAAIRKFLSRIEDVETRQNAADRCSELERTIRSLDVSREKRGVENAPRP